MLPERTRHYLLLDLDSAPDVLARMLQGVTDPAVFDARPDPARFTLREMVAHLADWEAVFLRRLTPWTTTTPTPTRPSAWPATSPGGRPSLPSYAACPPTSGSASGTTPNSARSR